MSHKPPSAEQLQSGLALRLQALDLLKKAQEIDGLRPFMAVCDQGDEQDEQFLWAHSLPSTQELEVVFGDVLNPGGRADLGASSFHDLDVLCGIAPDARLPDLLKAA
jgi:hypothetical protein